MSYDDDNQDLGDGFNPSETDDGEFLLDDMDNMGIKLEEEDGEEDPDKDH
jgi:hypothetical protein